MKKDKELFILVEFLLGVLLVILVAGMISEQYTTQKKKVVVIIEDSETDQWKYFISGLRQAAKNEKIQLTIRSTGKIQDAKTEKQMIEEELDNGIDGFLIQPVGGEEMESFLLRLSKKLPVMLVDSAAAIPKEKEELPVAGPDYYAMGKELGEEIQKDYAGNLQGKTFGILNSTEEMERYVQSEAGLLRVLENGGGEIIWNLSEKEQDEEAIQRLKMQKKVDIVIALDTNNLENAGSCAMNGELRGAMIYGIGTSIQAVYYMDQDYVRGLMVPDHFNMGYQSVTALSGYMKSWTGSRENQNVEYTFFRRKDIFTESAESYLFSVCQ